MNKNFINYTREQRKIHHIFYFGALVIFIIKETWRRLFENCVLNFMGPESTNACQDDQICDGLKAAIDGTVHDVQSIWDANFSTDECF